MECFYPIFFGKGVLIEHVNQDLKIEAEDRFDKFVKEERSSDAVWEEECFLSYDLFPVHQTSNLISIGVGTYLSNLNVRFLSLFPPFPSPLLGLLIQVCTAKRT